MGETGGFFSDVVAAGSHQQAIRMVAAGEIAAAAIDSQVLAIELRDHPALAGELRVIATLGPSTIQPVAALSVFTAQDDGAVLETAPSSWGKGKVNEAWKAARPTKR